MRRTGIKNILLPLFVSVMVALAVTYLIILYLPLIIAGILLLIVALIIFGIVLTVTWFVMQLVFIPYYALRKVKPKEEESKGGYRLEDVKQPESETIRPEKPRCPQCGAELRPDVKFCPNCGAELPHSRNQEGEK